MQDFIRVYVLKCNQKSAHWRQPYVKCIALANGPDKGMFEVRHLKSTKEQWCDIFDLQHQRTILQMHVSTFYVW